MHKIGIYPSARIAVEKYYNERNEQKQEQEQEIWFVEALLILLYKLCAALVLLFFSTRLTRVQCSGLNYFHFFDNKTFFVVAAVVVVVIGERKKN